jgi:chemotaxis protein methyltransferase CheR
VNLSHVFLEPSSSFWPERRRRLDPGPRKAGPGAARGPGSPPACGALRSDSLIAWLLGRAGVDARMYQSEALARRAQACLRRLGVRSEEDAWPLLEARPGLVEEVLDVGLIGVSSFFRDPAVFERLVGELDPLRRPRPAALRVLSVGASDGQELYSTGILLDEAGLLGSSDLLGVDCRPAAIARAREGRYAASQLEGVSAARLDRYFLAEQGAFVVRPSLKGRTRWQAADLFRVYESDFDVILCRNVAIYLEPEWSARLWEGMAARLCRGGLLVTGTAEYPPRDLPLSLAARCIFRKVV